MSKWHHYPSRVFIWLIQGLVHFYRFIISPILPPSCRFTPTCSEYALQALKQHGMYGTFLIIRRLLRCHPWGKHGFDPVPEGRSLSTQKKK